MAIPISCFACNPPTKWANEKEYQDHLATTHGTNSSDEAIKMERLKKANSPVRLPLGVPPEAAPTDEFIKTMAEIEKKKQEPQLAPSANPVPEPKKLEDIKLTYKYEGFDSCGNRVNTLELDANGKHFVIAYCLICQKQVEIREVADLKKITMAESFLINQKKKGKRG